VDHVTGPSTARRWAFSLVAMTLGLAVVEGGFRAVGAVLGTHQSIRSAGVSGSGGPVVVAVGDSVTQGIPEGRDHGWPARLAASTGATVHNLGAAGRGVGWMVDDLDRRRPGLGSVDIIVAMVGHNDCSYLADLASIHMPDAPTVTDRVRRGLRTLTTYRVLLQVVARVRPSEATVPATTRPADGTRQSDHCRTMVAAGVDALAARARALDAELVIATYPLPAHRDSPGQRVNQFLDTLLEEAALARGLRLADTRLCFVGTPPSDWHQDGVHLTRSGYARLGDCMAEVLGWAP